MGRGRVVVISLQASPVWTSLKSLPPAASPPLFDGSALMTRGEGGEVELQQQHREVDLTPNSARRPAAEEKTRRRKDVKIPPQKGWL